MDEKQTATKARTALPAAATAVRQRSLVAQMAPDFPALRLGMAHQAMGNRGVGNWVQAQLKVNVPGDAYEQEADRVADQVMRMPEPAAQRKCAACESGGPACSECAKEEERIQRMPAAQTHSPLAATMPTITGGTALPRSSRDYFESRMGYDFSSVRLHTGPEAERSAQALAARAYTFGSNIVFATGEYKPETPEGNRLLAHELTHVVQQSGPSRHDAPDIQRFTTSEHFDIGNAAYAMAAGEFSGPAFQRSSLYQTLRNGSQLPTGNRTQAYGDIVADGDFFQTFEDLIHENGERPGRAGMAVLATRNVHHFTPRNIHDWIPQHDFAVEQMLFAYRQLRFVRDWLDSIDPLLEGARAAILRDDYTRAERLMNMYRAQFEPSRDRMGAIAQSAHQLARQALARNAFAEHFLTDAFSAGHVVTPRAEILQEAGVRLDQMPTTGSLIRSVLLGTTWGELGEVRAQARSLAWHDLDNFNGVEVQNNDPGFAPWIACGDGCSDRTSDTHWAATRASVIRATAESIKDLWRAGLTGVRPADYRSVLDLVPRPTFNNYPAWGAAEWQNQLRYIRGDNAPHAPGETLDVFGVELHPIEHCAQPDIGCYNPFVLTDRDWIRQYSFDRWVVPWINRIRASAADRYRF